MRVNNSKTSKALISAIALILSGSLAYSSLSSPRARVLASASNISTVSSLPQTSSNAGDATTSLPVSDNKFKNGNYSVSIRYFTPGGEEGIDVALTLNADKITDISINQDPSRGESRRYQSRFQSSYQQYVIGQNIADLNLRRVSGASLTTDAFNYALAQIANQAS